MNLGKLVSGLFRACVRLVAYNIQKQNKIKPQRKSFSLGGA